MTRKTIKTILLASLIAVVILTVSEIMMADAIKDDPNKKMKKHDRCEMAKLIPYEGKVSTYERCLREAPSPITDFDKEYPRVIPRQSINGEESPHPINPPPPMRLTGGTTSFADENHEGFGTLLNKEINDIWAVYSKNQVHVDSITLQDDTFLYAPTILAPNYSGLEIVTYYGNEGNGLGTEKYVLVYNHNTQTFNWDNKHVIDSNFLNSYTLNWYGKDYFYTEILEYKDVWYAYIYNFDTHSWHIWDSETEDGPIVDGWVAWEEYFFDDNCPTTLPDITGKRIYLYHNEVWKLATSTLASEYDSGSICGITNATFNAEYYDWTVGN